VQHVFNCCGVSGNKVQTPTTFQPALRILTAILSLHSLVSSFYTVTINKTPMQSLCDNSGKYGPILIILSPLCSTMNSGISFYIICHLTSNLLPQYLVILEARWQILFRLFLQFIPECRSERIIKIGPPLPQLSQKDCALVFFYSQCMFEKAGTD